jgi:hypothetical protein
VIPLWPLLICRNQPRLNHEISNISAGTVQAKSS